MYLLLGYENDPCCQIVRALLHQYGHEVYMMAELFADDTFFRWTFDTTGSQSSLRWQDGRLISDNAWRGVLVRGRSGLMSSDGWKQDDLAYIREEIRQHSLPGSRVCSVLSSIASQQNSGLDLIALWLNGVICSCAAACPP